MNESELRSFVRFLYNQVNEKDKVNQEILGELREIRQDYKELLSKFDSLTLQMEKERLENRDLKEQIGKLEGQDGITFSGGDPLEQAEACSELAKYGRELGFNIWCYTGYTFEEILERIKYFPKIRSFLENVDVLVDGKFQLSEKSYDVAFRGSKNQRLIDIKESLKLNKVVLWTKDGDLSLTKRGRKNNYMFV